MGTDKRIRMGHVEGPGKGRNLPMTDGQYIARRGGKFGYKAVGAITLCGSTNFPTCWIESSKDDNGQNSWLTASGDYCHCIQGYDNLFEMPVFEVVASLAASQIGILLLIENYKLARDRSTATVTATTLQCVNVSNITATAAANGVVELVDVDTELPGHKVATVRMVPNHGQFN